MKLFQLLCTCIPTVKSTVKYGFLSNNVRFITLHCNYIYKNSFIILNNRKTPLKPKTFFKLYLPYFLLLLEKKKKQRHFSVSIENQLAWTVRHYLTASHRFRLSDAANGNSRRSHSNTAVSLFLRAYLLYA